MKAAARRHDGFIRGKQNIGHQKYVELVDPRTIDCETSQAFSGVKRQVIRNPANVAHNAIRVSMSRARKVQGNVIDRCASGHTTCMVANYSRERWGSYARDLSTMKNRQSMFMSGMRCVRCDHEIIAPRDDELLDDKIIRHLWHCPNC
jgi:uncharacterized protein with PIN domain